MLAWGGGRERAGWDSGSHRCDGLGPGPHPPPPPHARALAGLTVLPLTAISTCTGDDTVAPLLRLEKSTLASAGDATSSAGQGEGGGRQGEGRREPPALPGDRTRRGARCRGGAPRRAAAAPAAAGLALARRPPQAPTDHRLRRASAPPAAAARRGTGP
jgi:hypothetical protein